MELTQEYLKECFDYDPTTGNLIWRARPREHFDSKQVCGNSKRLVGRVAGALGGRGYRYIHVGKRHLAHRLVWCWHHGWFPSGDTDHINRNRTDNRIENLRECSRVQNLQGRRSSRKHRGVYRSSPNRWSARIIVSGKGLYLGSFKSEKDAALAYARAAVDHFGAFAPIEAKKLFEESYP